uniref:DUF1640 domain-containing protein n=1 Tax=Candidatus Kentrum sp. TC TaxID=2126339 RepID=A0A450YHH6_9GAMM|nr:MAG: hypothetical protein BECKTC1821E_GA0114239_10093 [Candidatus Kentron sp. TC]
MTTIAIDTLKFVRRLTDVGMEKQADAHARAVNDVLSNRELAAKADPRDLELRLEAKIATIRFDMLEWMVGLLLAQTALIFTILPKLL